ncbi:MAG: phospholipase D-like domain-containing protein [Bryobacterales bacterium]|nr:phospholipase D-like domain-containing protein [Bryobacterales bacterium]
MSYLRTATFNGKSGDPHSLPEIYFDPRSLDTDSKRRAVLHAKCIVIDGRTSFVSSANFTEAAQERNIEVGVLIRSEVVASRLIGFFTALISSGATKRVV